MAPMNNTIADQSTIVREWLAAAEEYGEKDTYLSKRQSARVTWNEPLIATDVSKGSKHETFYVRTRNVSEEGMSFLSRQPIPLHTRLEIHLDTAPANVVGVVVHCSTALGGYMIGVSFK